MVIQIELIELVERKWRTNNSRSGSDLVDLLATLPNIAWACERGGFSKANPVSLCMKIHNSYKSGDEDAQKFGILIDAIEAGMAELYDTNGSLTTQLAISLSRKEDSTM